MFCHHAWCQSPRVDCMKAEWRAFLNLVAHFSRERGCCRTNFHFALECAWHIGVLVIRRECEIVSSKFYIPNIIHIFDTVLRTLDPSCPTLSFVRSSFKWFTENHVQINLSIRENWKWEILKSLKYWNCKL